MKKLFYFLLLITVVNAKEYYAKVEPIHIYTIASQVSGTVIKADENLLGKKLNGEVFLAIDNYIDLINVKNTKKNIQALHDLISQTKIMIKNLSITLKRKKENYNKIKDLSIKSKTQKDALFFDIVATKNQILSAKKELDNYSIQLNDLLLKKAQLEKTLHDKTLTYKGKLLYDLLVQKGDYVTPSKPLAKIADISKGIITIYVDATELKGITEKTIYIDGEKTSYKVSRVIPIADSTNLSEYKVQIIINPPKIFSKLVKVELK